ncbi:MAG: hypothetical protein RLZZ450_246 [Pseudomonadota bacterium]
MSSRSVCAWVRSPLSRWALSWSLCGPSALVAATVHAEEAAAPSAYDSLIDQALSEYEAKNFPEARALFLRAEALHSNARVLRSLGMVEFELRNYRDSATLLQQALTSSVEPLTPALRSETAELLARARGFTVRLVLTVEPSSTRVTVDGTPAEFLNDDGTLLLEVGDHNLLFRAPGYVTETRVLKGRGGEEQTLHVALTPETQPTTNATTTATWADLADQSPPAANVPWFFVVPRFSLVMPGSGTVKIKADCKGAACGKAPEDSSSDYSRGSMPMLGADAMFALLPELRLGLGLHVQLNKSSYDFGSDSLPFEAGRLFSMPATAEYRLGLGHSLALPLRLQTALLFLKPGRDAKAVDDSNHERCKQNAAAGVSCSVNAHIPGFFVGAGPGVAFQLANVALRADLTLGHQWLRHTKIERSARGPSGFSSSAKQTDGSFIAALSIAAEF